MPLPISEVKDNLNKLVKNEIKSFSVPLADFPHTRRQIINQNYQRGWKLRFNFTEVGTRVVITLQSTVLGLSGNISPKVLRVVESLDASNNVILSSCVLLKANVFDSILFFGVEHIQLEQLKLQESHAIFFEGITIQEDEHGTRLVSDEYLSTVNPQTI